MLWTSAADAHYLIILLYKKMLRSTVTSRSIWCLSLTVVPSLDFCVCYSGVDFVSCLFRVCPALLVLFVDHLTLCPFLSGCTSACTPAWIILHMHPASPRLCDTATAPLCSHFPQFFAAKPRILHYVFFFIWKWSFKKYVAFLNDIQRYICICTCIFKYRLCFGKVMFGNRKYWLGYAEFIK